MQAGVDVDKLWAALQQTALGFPKASQPKDPHNQLTRPKRTVHRESAGDPLSKLQQPALRIETAQQKLQSTNGAEKLASLKAIKVVKCIGICAREHIFLM